jgi:hypothetical protein
VSHPGELLDRITTLLEQDYPPSEYRYLREQFISGTRMSPDIQIETKKGALICAVEVGYTRPEKLTAYRDVLKIPDVRWYDKQGNLHTPLQRSSSRVRFALEIEAPKRGCSVYVIQNEVPCSCVDEDCEEMQLDSEQSEMRRLEDVFTWVITDHHFKAIFACFCDKCGGTWTQGEDALLVDGGGEDFLLTPNQLRQRNPDYERVFYGSWDDCVQHVYEHTEISEDVSLSYDECTHPE